MKKILSLFVFTILAVSLLLAQKKDISYEQAFSSKPTNISKPLPTIGKWIDNDHYLETKRDSAGKTKTYSVSAKTGESVLYEEIKKENTPKRDVAVPKDAKNQTWSPDGKYVAFTLNNDLYVRDADTEKEYRVTSDGSENIKNGYASWVYMEEILGRASRYRAFWWSPDSRYITFMRFDDTKLPAFPIYVLKDQHGYLENERYPKSGDPNPEVKIGLVDVSAQKLAWADFNEKDDQYFGPVLWTPDNKLWVQWMNRGQDNLKIYHVDIATGAKNEVYDEKQSTWVSLDMDSRVQFLSNNTMLFKSDKSGWMHLYLYDMSGKLISQPTSGEFSVGQIYKVDEKNKMIWFAARKENTARWDLYSVGFDGKKMTRLTFGDYSFAGMNISPDNKYFITSYSNIATPTRMVLMDMKGNQVRELGDVKGTEFANYDLPKRELVRVKSADGLFDLPVLITYPLNFDPNKKYPVIASIYGGPGAGTVMDTWQASPSSLWWAKEGLIQVSFDNRSSGHFGKKGMDYIHRQMGKYEIEDYMACGKWLKSQSYVDGNRLGITGGSFGGYMTCMALTYGADVFTHGIAQASVTDWQFYDTHYTERYMDTPKENPEGYKATSVMTYADKLKGNLRIVHGTTDDNVHMQNSLVLIDKLQNLKKQFDFMIYPGERHGIGGNNPAKSAHNVAEARTFYYQQLLQKPVPQEIWQTAPQRGF